MADAMEPKVIYEDSSVIVIDKPAGLRVHPVHPGEKGTLVDFLLARWPEIKEIGDPSTGSTHSTTARGGERSRTTYSPQASSGQGLRPGIVHRLDADTSGVMAVVKTNEAFQYLKRQFQERRVEKRYLALVHGMMHEHAGEINYSIGHGAHTATKRTVKRDAKNVRGEREALTAWRLIKQYAGFALLEVMPKTGRTHQIRVHMAAIGHSITGDPLYGSKKLVLPPGLTRLFLHASHLEFSLPGGPPKARFVPEGGQRLVFESDLPAELQSVLDALGDR